MSLTEINKYGLTTFSLKIIAMITMLADHIGIMFFEDIHQPYVILRSIGRLSFPIYCFILTEGFFHTGSRKNYAIRLGAFALISEIPYDMFHGKFWDLGAQNVMFTLLFGFLIIWAIDSVKNYEIKYPQILIDIAGEGLLNALLKATAVILGVGAAYFLNSTYSYAGVVFIICFYFAHEHKIGQLLSNMLFNMGFYLPSIQWLGVLSAVPIALYNGRSGPKKGKYIFYLFYPVHLVALTVIKYLYLRIF